MTILYKVQITVWKDKSNNIVKICVAGFLSAVELLYASSLETKGTEGNMFSDW